MSARSVVEHALKVYLQGSKDPEGVARQALDNLLNEHAHELAEKIRESTRNSLTRVTATHGADWGRTWAQGREKAADKIDPEVTDGS